ncbi:uncharacterized protein LOC127705593 isoform X2 [Mytilus californianus]|uniref:uncharacterized protein LOC127705593 isoform X2 n=1 Tax=Mytilus californianus TaxID=6549 RepID=UPI002247CB3C|nr:uncharacterized protein LOC127705593 isoform X2 [Mytilus californianus]
MAEKGTENTDASLTNDDSILCKMDQFGVPAGFEDFGDVSNNSDQSADENSENGTTLWDEIIDDCLKNADLIDEDGNNVLHKLVQMGDADNLDNFGRQINKLLLGKGKEFVKGSLKHKNNIGNTPLLELLRCEDMDCVNREALQIFLNEDYEYDINTSNNMKLGPLHIIMSKEFLPNIYENVSSAIDKQMLDDYNKKRNIIATMLLKARANVNQKDIFDRTPLFLTNAISSVQLLIDNEADLNINDKFGRSILLAAVSMENHKHLTRYYIETMDKEIILHSDVYQSTLFHYVAILQKELDICDYLECKDRKGWDYLECKDRKGWDYLECKDIKGHAPNEVSRFRLQSEIKGIPNVNIESIHSLLQKRGIGAPWDHEESEYIKQTVIKFAEELCIAIGEEDARLKCTLQRSGSSEEGTKVGDPNEFDFIFCLDEIQKLCSVKDLKMEKEFVELNANMANKDIPQPFTIFFGEDGLCKISEVRLAFSRAVKTIVFNEKIWKSKDIIFGKLKNSKECDKPVITLEIRWFGCSYKDEIISIDLVPAIRKMEWWPSNGGCCDLLNASIKGQGCLLLFQTTVMVQSETHLRISCSPAEIDLLKNVLPPYCLEGYRLCKLLYLWLTNIHSSDDKYIQACIKNKLITSYMFKNCLFYVFENYKKKGNPEATGNYHSAIVDLVGDILSCLQSFNKKLTFPVYFIPRREDIFIIKPYEQINLMKELKEILKHQCETRAHVIMYMQKIHGRGMLH